MYISPPLADPTFCSISKSSSPPPPPPSSSSAVLLAALGIYIAPHRILLEPVLFPFVSYTIMAHTYQASIDDTSHLKTESTEFTTPSPTASSSCTPRCCPPALASLDLNTPVSNLKLEHNAFQIPSPAGSCCTLHRLRRRQALASLDRNSPVNRASPSSSSSASSSSTKAKHLPTPRTDSPSNKKKEKEKEKENQHVKHNIPSPVLIISPPALERLQHDLTNRRRPFDDSEEDDYYARRRANVSRMREFREKARRLSKTIRKTRRELDEGIQRFGGGGGVGGSSSPERIQKWVAGFGISDSS